jgi:hypothetical protein
MDESNKIGFEGAIRELQAARQHIANALVPMSTVTEFVTKEDIGCLLMLNEMLVCFRQDLEKRYRKIQECINHG